MKSFHSVLFGIVFFLITADCSSAQGSYRHFFEDGITRRLFKCRLEIAGQSLSGVLLVKRLGDFSFRAVYTAETGFTFFDIALADDAAIFNSGVGPFKKKIIQRALAGVLQSAILRPLDCAFKSGERQAWTCSRLRFEMNAVHSDEFPHRMGVFKGKKEQFSANFYFSHSRRQMPDSIRAVSDGLSLKMSFRLLDQ